MSCFFDRGTCWVLPLTYLYLPKSARAYLFPQSVKISYFCSGSISADPSGPRPRLDVVDLALRALIAIFCARHMHIYPWPETIQVNGRAARLEKYDSMIKESG